MSDRIDPWLGAVVEHCGGRPPAGTFTAARLPADLGRKADAHWTRTLGARLLGEQLVLQPKFWSHVHEVRERREPEHEATLARRYVRRASGETGIAVVSAFLHAAAFPGEYSVGRACRTDLENLDEIVLDRFGESAVYGRAVHGAYFCEAPLEPHEPKYAARRDLAQSLARAAIRVARRGAGRCANPACCIDPRPRLRNVPRERRPGQGAILAADWKSDYCAACDEARRVTRDALDVAQKTEKDEDRRLFEHAAAFLFGRSSRGERRRLTAPES